MPEPAEIVHRRDRLIILAALCALTLVSWDYIIWLGANMSGGAMPPEPAGPMRSTGTDMGSPMAMGNMLMPGFRAWTPAQFIAIYLMWAVMMVGMMLPTVSPMVLLYARVGRAAHAQQAPFASAGWFVAGYLLTWWGFALFATTVQWALDRAALLSPGMVASSHVLGGLVLVVAGLYQWTPLKQACLSSCRSPLQFVQTNGGFRPDAWGAMGMGLRHGAYCMGCCWALMALLFVGGVMNVLWIAALTFLVLAEKVTPFGDKLARVAGLVAFAWGIALLWPAFNGAVS